MKKLLLATAILIVGGAYAQDVLQQFYYADEMNFADPLVLSDGVTPIPDGYLIQLRLTQTQNVYSPFFDGAVDDPIPVNNNWCEDSMNGEELGVGPGYFMTDLYFIWEDSAGSPPEPVANCSDQIYIMIYDAPTQAAATEYITSEFITGPSAGSQISELEVLNWNPWLPIETGENWNLTLLSFEANLQDEVVVISWVTASESGLENFNLYRDDIFIYQVDATNSSEITEYQFIDEFIENQATYDYTLEVVCLDGTTTFVGLVELTIEMEKAEDEVMNSAVFENIYPNPVRVGATQHIKFSVKTGETATLTIYNAKGQFIETMNFKSGYHDFEFTPKFASGIYFYKLKESNYTTVKKILILK